MIDIYMRQTGKGKVFWTYVGVGARCKMLIAYRYDTGNISRTRYKIKDGDDTRAKSVSVRKMLKEYPIAFSILRDATGTRSYDL